MITTVILKPLVEETGNVSSTTIASGTICCNCNSSDSLPTCSSGLLIKATSLQGDCNKHKHLVFWAAMNDRSSILTRGGSAQPNQDKIEW